MKQMLKKTALALVASTALAGNAMAADKVAIVDIQGVFGQLPQIATIQQKIEDEFAPEREKIKKLEADITYNMDKLKRENATMSKAQKEELQNQIISQRKEFESMVKPLEVNIRRRQNEERNKIVALIMQTIEAEAKSGDYDMVLQKSAVIYSKDAKDLTDEIVKKVGKLR